MFRRRTPTDRRPEGGPSALRTPPADLPASSPGPTAASRISPADLADAGWLLPRAVAAGAAPKWTLAGTVGSPTATAVDTGGLVVGDGWSLDWWIGADDRWHLPAREAAVRQRLVDDAPVVETSVRIPGGDALHRAYGVRSPRAVGDEWVVAEVENATSIPFAVALVIRPFVADGIGDVHHISLEKVRGGKGRDGAHLVRVDGVPAVVLPRLPARFASGSCADGDVLAVVTSGAAGSDLIEASCPDGLATLALVFPLPHTAVLRTVLPVGPGAEAGAEVEYPNALPDAASVASGWDVHRRGPRFEIPDRRLSEAVHRARAHVVLAHDGASVRRDGVRAPSVQPGATEVLLGAFDVLDRPEEVDAVVARWPDQLALVDSSLRPADDAVVLESIARHFLLHRSQPVFDFVLPEVSAAVERIGRSDRRGRLVDAAARQRAARALDLTAWTLAEVDQEDAGRAVAELATRLADDASGAPADAGDLADRILDAGRARDHAALVAACASLSATGAGEGPGHGGRRIGHDLAASAAVVLAVRDLLVAERPDGLDLLPTFPDAWYGGGVELHDAPTAHGRLSFAIRWHGTRPALLWDLEPHVGRPPVLLRVPGLDPSWSTTETRGDALLAEVLPPEGLDLVREVVEHPDIDPAMRRPGTAPDPVAPAPELPEGGTFS